jgi:phytoene synthase
MSHWTCSTGCAASIAGTPLTSLDAAFVARAIPTGSARHLSYLFAPALLRAPLLGVYALLAEWQALLDPSTERSVAELKLAWWHEEMLRLSQGTAVHPVSRHLASQPGAAAGHFKLLIKAVEAAMVELGGVPLELGAQLEPHSAALIAGPLRLASLIAAVQPSQEGLDHCTKSLAVAQYLARALREYRREAHRGRVPFAVDELLQAGIENADLLSPTPPPHLQHYLDGLRSKADECYAQAAREVPPAARSGLRHLLVLAALGRKHLRAPGGNSAFGVLKDMLLAWDAARRAAQ